MQIKKYISFTTFTVIIIGIFSLFIVSNTQRNCEYLLGYKYFDKQNIILQTSKSDCGPAALMNVFQHYEIKSSLEEIELIAGTTDAGTSMLGLKQMAELKGLKAEGWQYTWEDFINTTFPVIAFVRGNHYVVVDSIYNNGDLIIIDPARGRLKMSARKFKRIWQGKTLQIERVGSKEPTRSTEG